MSKVKEFKGGLFDASPRALVLGIDQSYSGFALTVMAAEGDPLYHSWVFIPDGKGIRRLVSIMDFIDSTLSEVMEWGYSFTDAAMEGYAYGAQMAHMAGELGGAVKITLDKVFVTEKAKYPLIIPPANLKKYVTGKGTGVQKNQMLLNIYKKWGVEFTDDNAADSYALARLVSGRADTSYEKEMVTKLSDPKFRDK